MRFERDFMCSFFFFLFVLLHLFNLSRECSSNCLPIHLVNTARACISLFWKCMDPSPLKLWLQKGDESHAMEELTSALHHTNERLCKTYKLNLFSWFWYPDGGLISMAFSLKRFGLTASRLLSWCGQCPLPFPFSCLPFLFSPSFLYCTFVYLKCQVPHHCSTQNDSPFSCAYITDTA